MEEMPAVYTRYLDSLDSVRTNPLKHDDLDAIERRILHAKIEVLLAVLSGFRIYVPGAYSFDSKSFVDIFNELLNSRDRAKQNGPERARMRYASVYNPFIVYLLDRFPSYRSMVSAAFDRSGFHLSTFPEINIENRKVVATAIDQKGFAAAKRSIPPEFIEYFEKLEKIDAYTNEREAAYPTLKKFSLPKIRLENYYEWLSEIEPDSLACYGSNFVSYVANLKNTFFKVLRNEISYNDRSALHNYIYQKHLQKETLFVEALEFMDSCYNRALAYTSDATHHTFSTGIDDTITYTAPSQLVSFLLDQQRLGKVRFCQQQDSNLDKVNPLSFSAEPLAKSLGKSRPKGSDKIVYWFKIWDKLWEVVGQYEWRFIANELHHGLRDNDVKRVDEALDQLVVFAGKAFHPLTIERGKDGVISVRGMFTWAGRVSLVAEFANYVFAFGVSSGVFLVGGAAIEAANVFQRVRGKISMGLMQRAFRKSLKGN